MLAVMLVAAAVAGWWFYPRWWPSAPAAAPTSTKAVAGGGNRALPAPAAPESALSLAPKLAPAPAAAACWSPGPLGGSALATSKKARFATVEQLLGTAVPAAGQVYRVQARLTGIALQPDRSYRLSLTSLVDPRRQLTARLPAGQCVAQREDAALYDELREDIVLRFGSPALQPLHLAQPATVLVTAPAAVTPAGVVLEPVLDLSVQ